MEKELKFKKEWFDVLNRCNQNLRADVFEAVFQYFFTGVEPNFTDEARIIAFGFIRADIDATRRRRQARLARKQKATPAPANETPTEMAPKDSPAEPQAPLTFAEKARLTTLLMHWNNLMQNLNMPPVPITVDFAEPIYIPVINAIRRATSAKISQQINQLYNKPGKPDFAQFFNSITTS